MKRSFSVPAWVCCRNQDPFPPRIMNLLTLSLVAILVATAHSLVCKCTAGPGCSLLGTCSAPDSGVCLTMAQKNNLGLPWSSRVYRACEQNAQVCDENVMTLTVGKGLYWTSRTECCTTDNCNAASISVPPVSLTPNGRECPACFAVGSDCAGPETQKCTGDQDHCITISGTMDEGAVSVPFIAKGCSTATTCLLPVEKALGSTGVTLKFKSITCDPAPSGQSGHQYFSTAGCIGVYKRPDSSGLYLHPVHREPDIPRGRT
ncbi:PREDICTED: phospholipase A2 inhibitor and Ly6/PLAUR domain-containing protein-like, partial [Gekko japonicus]|uniref:Phospholipase A2 inhibitor and Ly6/PLAUR domain-containing protein-like n=1 Tax=Gekko japonicus TaxID=146911 RepID=A0ABM1K4G1_GEKJA